jgi:hypothetical protein
MIKRTVTETRYNGGFGEARASYCPWCRLVGRPGKINGGFAAMKAHVFTRHSGRMCAAIVSVILLSVVDAMLTLFLVSCGAREMNPVMAYFLDHGPLAFFWAKYLLTCIPLVFLLMHKGVRLFGSGVRAQALLSWMAVPFVLVVYWEIYLVLCVV